MRFIFVIISMYFFSGLVFAGADDFQMTTRLEPFEVSPGTFSSADVASPEDCTKLCESEDLCRGYEVLQPDTRYQKFQCYLNDGRSKGSPFEIKTPAALDMNRALRELNAYRAENGLKTLTFNSKLTEASRRHARDLANHGQISHDGSNGSNHADRALAAGYKYRFIAENVATGQKSWDEVFKGWQNSPGHNENLLNRDVSEFGVALVFEPDTKYITYWAMLVGKPQ